MAKNSAYLTRLQVRHEAETQARLADSRERVGQIHIISMLFAAHDVLQLGPGRAGKFLRAYLVTKIGILQQMNEDIGESRKAGDRRSGDSEMEHTRRDLARRLERIISRADLPAYKQLFPFLDGFWEEDLHVER